MARTKKRPTEPKIRCAIYTRKSTEDGLDQEFNSLDAQREAGEAFIASQKNEGWVFLPNQYDDGGFSGGNAERPALKRLLADIEDGQIDCVVVYKVDRLSRSLLDFARIMGTFESHNVSFVSVTQQFNTTHSMGRLTLNILLSFAQFEREIIGERIRDKIAAQRRRGKWAGGVPVLGYDVDRSGGSPKLVVNATEATRVRQIFDLYLTLGSLLPVIDQLDERVWCNKSWTTKSGKPKGGRLFDKGSLYALLTNPLYAGKIKHKAEIYDGEHESIITDEQFRKVQDRLQKNCRTGGAEVRNRHGALLKGLIFCKSCNRTMVHNFTGKGSKRYRYYTCTKAISRGRKSCPSRSLPAAEIEATIVDQIRCIASDHDLRNEVLRQAQSEIETELVTLRTERNELSRELKRHHAEIRRLAVNGDQSSATTALIADLHDRIGRAEVRSSELDDRIPTLEREQLSKEDVAAAFDDFDGVWESLSPREQAQIIGLLVSRIEFDAKDSSVAVCFHVSAIKTLAERAVGEAA